MKKLFVHKSELSGTLHENDAVEFEIQKGKKRLKCSQCQSDLIE